MARRRLTKGELKAVCTAAFQGQGVRSLFCCGRRWAGDLREAGTAAHKHMASALHRKMQALIANHRKEA